MTNRLASATSPYLTQHAENPVDWYPWGEEALARARAEDKPLLVSIGYSACHWCHVMAHESFEDPDVAAIMNAHFINVKVDREERPDIDQICQTAHALLTRRAGGWPLTIFFAPTGEPFFSGTYFPKHERYGLPGFIDLLPRIAAAFKSQRGAIVDQSRRLTEAMQALEPRVTSTAVPARAPGAALAGLKRTFDRTHGGFGGAPKFPHEAELDFCLRAWASARDADALTIVRTTLQRMAEGGIYDQIGGGFCRYSVDAEWTIPHFEKMLYDNGPLLGLYADASRATGEPGYRDIAQGIAGFLEREMTAPDGSFYSSLDADSEGEEGRFYVWTPEEARRAMRFDEWAVAAPYYGLDRAPNFEGRAWHLRVSMPLAHVAQRLGMPLPDAQHRLAGAKAALLAQRNTRVRPARDEKILTSWNALAIMGLARASRALDEPRFADAAFAAADALARSAWRDGRLYATRRGGRAELNAYLDDHAFLLAALLELMQTRFRAQDWSFASRVADTLLDQFEDWKTGGFWFTSHGHEKLFHRSKAGHDNATPSGNGIAAQALIAFGHLASEARYLDAAQRAVRVFSPALAEAPTGYASLLTALEDLEVPPTVVVLDGERSEAVDWHRSLERLYRPSVRIINIAGDNECPRELRKGRTPAHGVAAWVCHGTSCRPPVGSLPELEAMLASGG